mmetsp:Transcript_70224/g.227351  ORF Transcript_70224/g.227351 Transcript_70224/m.227351 type:complete len:345 (-) Transcript_70224:1725-2759(-)
MRGLVQSDHRLEPRLLLPGPHGPELHHRRRGRLLHGRHLPGRARHRAQRRLAEAAHHRVHLRRPGAQPLELLVARAQPVHEHHGPLPELRPRRERLHQGRGHLHDRAEAPRGRGRGRGGPRREQAEHRDPLRVGHDQQRRKRRPVCPQRPGSAEGRGRQRQDRTDLPLGRRRRGVPRRGQLHPRRHRGQLRRQGPPRAAGGRRGGADAHVRQVEAGLPPGDGRHRLLLLHHREPEDRLLHAQHPLEGNQRLHRLRGAGREHQHRDHLQPPPQLLRRGKRLRFWRHERQHSALHGDRRGEVPDARGRLGPPGFCFLARRRRRAGGRAAARQGLQHHRLLVAVGGP